MKIETFKYLDFLVFLEFVGTVLNSFQKVQVTPWLLFTMETKNILLKLDEKSFYQLANLKSRYEMVLKESLTWEQFILRLKINFERQLK
jgi:hypothetical protein